MRARFSLSGLAAAQAGRGVLWLPMAAMAGAGAYFLAPREPALWAAPAFTAASILAGLLFAAWPTKQPDGLWRGTLVAFACLCALAAAGGLGFSVATFRSAAVAAPRLEREIGPVAVEGWVVDATMGARRPRLKLLVRGIEGVARPPRFVELSTTEPGALPPGRTAHCFAVLRPPAGPMAPGGYDRQFNAWFERVGGIGFSFGACRPGRFEAPAAPLDAMLVQAAALRRAITETIAEAAPGRGGAVAAALVTGDRSLIDADTTRVFRDSGLAHLLSVSGVHMALVGGMVFAAVHVLLALIAPLALRFPIRKWAAATAIAATGFYLAISGNSVPAQRSFVMIAVAMGAILVDRPAITLRGLGVAAFIVTLFTPEAVATPGFQMSFAASAALVAAFEAAAARAHNLPPVQPGMLIASLQRGWDWFAGALMTSAVAGAATDPFALMHFQRVAIYGLPTNLIAEPLVSLIVAPAAAGAVLLAPFGLADHAIKLAAGALDFLVAAGAVFADRPEAVRHLPSPPDAAFALWVVALAWGCIWRGALRWAALAPMAAGALLYAFAAQPIIWTDDAGQGVVARVSVTSAPPHWAAMRDKRGAFEVERLGGLAGLSDSAIAALPEPEGCTPDACAWRTPMGRQAGLARTAAGFAQLCLHDALILAQAAPPAGWAQHCKPALPIDPSVRAARGGAAVTETRAGFTAAYARGRGEARPWRAADLGGTGERGEAAQE